MSDDCSLPDEDRQFFEQRIQDFVRSLLHCQGHAHLVMLEDRIRQLTAQWEAAHAQTGQITQDEVRQLAALRDQRLGPLLQDLHRRFDPRH